jgi:hypothetical protein
VGDAVECNDDCYALLPLKYCGEKDVVVVVGMP